MRSFVIILLCSLFLAAGSSFSADKSPAEKARAVIEHYKRNVTGIILKGENKVIKGRIRAFRRKGILFDPAKSGPFYDPKPQYYPMSQIQAFVGRDGKVLWGHIMVKPKPDYLKIRRYRFLLGAQYGLGNHSRSYIFEPIAPEDYDYVQELQAGNNIVARAALFISPKYTLGIKFLQHNTAAKLYGLQVSSGNTANEATIKDDITIQNFMLDFGIYHAVRRNIFIHANVMAGLLNYSADREKKVTISKSAFCAMPGVGMDFLLQRNVAVTVDAGYLFGAIKDPDVSDDTELFTGQQSMERFDINVGLSFFF